MSALPLGSALGMSLIPLLLQTHHGFLDDERGQAGLDGDRAPLDVAVQGAEAFCPAAEAARDGAALHPHRQGRLEGLEPEDGGGEPGRRQTSGRGSRRGPLPPAAGQEEPKATKSVPQATKDYGERLSLIFGRISDRSVSGSRNASRPQSGSTPSTTAQSPAPEQQGWKVHKVHHPPQLQNAAPTPGAKRQRPSKHTTD